jgi:hypothetical protein
MLSVLVQKSHCWNVMNDAPMTANVATTAATLVTAGVNYLIAVKAGGATIGGIMPAGRSSLETASAHIIPNSPSTRLDAGWPILAKIFARSQPDRADVFQVQTLLAQSPGPNLRGCHNRDLTDSQLVHARRM